MVEHQVQASTAGVTLLAIESGMAPLERRRKAWTRLARDLEPQVLDTIVTEMPLRDEGVACGPSIAGRLE
jgi:acrylyl-CoA reductase (NADPH)